MWLSEGKQNQLNFREMIEDCENSKTRKWYTNYTFPLIPVISYRKANQYNTFNWTFHWMFFKVWTRDAFDFEIAFTISGHWGIGVTALLPYLRLVITVPCTEWLSIKIDKYLGRKPKQLKTNEK
jgi:hypothetical protein